MRRARGLFWSVFRFYRFAIVALCVRSRSEWRTPLTLLRVSSSSTTFARRQPHPPRCCRLGVPIGVESFFAKTAIVIVWSHQPRRDISAKFDQKKSPIFFWLTRWRVVLRSSSLLGMEAECLDPPDRTCIRDLDGVLRIEQLAYSDPVNADRVVIWKSRFARINHRWPIYWGVTTSSSKTPSFLTIMIDGDGFKEFHCSRLECGNVRARNKRS